MNIAVTSSTKSGRAMVIGASVAGLLAARVLSETFDEVIMLERDALPDRAAPRKGTPHAVHPHGLLAQGRMILDELFPGFTDTLVVQGGLSGDIGTARDVRRRRVRRVRWRYVPAVEGHALTLQLRICGCPERSLIRNENG